MLSPRMTWRPESGTSSTPACRAKRQHDEQTKHLAGDSSDELQIGSGEYLAGEHSLLALC